MNPKRQFFKEQAEKFREYANKFPGGDLLSIFDKWADSKDIIGADKHEIWRIARTMRGKHFNIIKEESEEFVRLSTVLEILFEHDMERISTLARKNKLTKPYKSL